VDGVLSDDTYYIDNYYRVNMCHLSRLGEKEKKRLIILFKKKFCLLLFVFVYFSYMC